MPNPARVDLKRSGGIPEFQVTIGFGLNGAIIERIASGGTEGEIRIYKHFNYVGERWIPLIDLTRKASDQPTQNSALENVQQAKLKKTLKIDQIVNVVNKKQFMEVADGPQINDFKSQLISTNELSEFERMPSNEDKPLIGKLFIDSVRNGLKVFRDPQIEDLQSKLTREQLANVLTSEQYLFTPIFSDNEEIEKKEKENHIKKLVRECHGTALAITIPVQTLENVSSSAKVNIRQTSRLFGDGSQQAVIVSKYDKNDMFSDKDNVIFKLETAIKASAGS